MAPGNIQATLHHRGIDHHCPRRGVGLDCVPDMATHLETESVVGYETRRKAFT